MRKDLAEEVVRVLGAVARVVSRSAVAEGDVEKAVVTELDHAAVVVLERLGDHQQDPLGVRIGDVDARGRPLIFGDHGRAVGYPRVVHEEPSVGGELGMKGQPEQALLAAGQDAAHDVEEHRRSAGAGLQQLDPAPLLDDEQAAGAVAAMGDVEG